MQWPSLNRGSHSYQLVGEAKDNSSSSSSPSAQLLTHTKRQLALWRISCIISWILTCSCILFLPVDRTGIAAPSTTIENSPQYRDFTHAGDKAWDDLLTPNFGFYVRTIDGKKEAWGISMFHQIHCLSMMRTAYQSLLLGEDSEHSHGRAENGTMHEIPEHITHCYDYLRQVSIDDKRSALWRSPADMTCLRISSAQPTAQ